MMACQDIAIATVCILFCCTVKQLANNNINNTLYTSLNKIMAKLDTYICTYRTGMHI